MADTGEDREIRERVEAKDAETFRESKQLATKTKAANQYKGKRLTLAAARVGRTKPKPKH